MNEYMTGDEISVKIISKNFEPNALKDTTIGNVYDGVFTEKGDMDPDDGIAVEDSITIIDDVGEMATFWISDKTSYELV